MAGLIKNSFFEKTTVDQINNRLTPPFMEGKVECYCIGFSHDFIMNLVRAKNGNFQKKYSLNYKLVGDLLITWWINA